MIEFIDQQTKGIITGIERILSVLMSASELQTLRVRPEMVHVKTDWVKKRR